MPPPPPSATPASGDCTLYITGSMPASGQFGLYISGVLALSATRSMPLSLRATELASWSGGLPVYIGGATGVPNLYNTTPLVLEASLGNRPTRSMNLAMYATNVGVDVRNVNLWVGGCAFTADASVGLMLRNDQSGVQGTATLFVEGSGSNDGYVPSTRGMNLFIKRNEAAQCSLYIAGPGASGVASVPLVIGGAGLVTGTAPLSIPVVVGGLTNSATLYTHGF